MKRWLFYRPSGVATAVVLFFVVIGIPLGLLYGGDIYGALMLNGVFCLIFAPWAYWRTKRYWALPSDEAREAETQRVERVQRRNRKLVGYLLIACVAFVLIWLLLH